MKRRSHCDATKRALIFSAIVVSILSGALMTHSMAQLPGPPTLVGVTLSRAIVTGGSGVSCVVTLDRAAPTGFVVRLAASGPEVTVPASVTVPVGSTIAKLAIITTPVDQDTSLAITASTSATDSKSAKLTLLAPVPRSLTLSSATTSGGGSVRATIALTGPASERGLNLRLTSSNPTVAAVPASISISPGKASTIFNVTTTRVSADTPVTISINSPEGISANLTVALPLVAELISMTCNPSAIPTNAMSLNLVFDRPVSADHTVQFTSSNATVFPVPAVMHFQSGTTSIPVAVTPNQVTSDTTVTITAVSGNSTKTVNTTVHPLVIQTFSASATEIIGGSRPVITVAMNLPRVEATQIMLVANSNLVTIPSSLIIPGRSNDSTPPSVTFELITLAATNQTSVTITAAMPAALGGGTKTLTITILPVALASVSLQKQQCDLTKDCPSTISGTLTLNGAAPVGGLTIQLSSDRPQSATVLPSSVLIAQGQSTGAFSVAIPQAAALGNVQITAQAGSGSSKSTTLALTKTFLGVESLTLSSGSTQGGTPIVGTVTVRQYVVSGNGPQVQTPVTPTQSQVNVTVSISGSGLSQQLSLNVPAGQSNGTFNYTPPSTAATESRNLMAFANSVTGGDGVGRTATLTVNPATFNAFTLSENNVQGGKVVTGTIQMSGPVPFSNSVTVTSSDQAAASNINTQFASNSPNGTVTVQTSANVTNPTTVTLTASFAGQTSTAQLTVTRPSTLSGISFPSNRLLSGVPTTLRIDLDGPAPNGGATIFLTGGPGSVVPVQPQVTIPAGQSSASVAVTPVNVPNPTLGNVVASFGNNQSKFVQVTVESPAIDICNASPSNVTGGSTINCTVTLLNSGMVAPEGGIRLNIQNSNPTIISLPQTITIPAGQNSTSLQITTQQVTQNTDVNLALSLPNQGFSRHFTLTP